LLVSQPDLAKELSVQSPTVRRWCQMLGLEPAYQLGRNYYTLEQADLIRRYGSAGTTQRRAIPRLHFNYLTETTERWAGGSEDPNRRYIAFHPKGLSLEL
jgi:hypothetical protein